jgi:hypothetical protein
MCLITSSWPRDVRNFWGTLFRTVNRVTHTGFIAVKIKFIHLGFHRGAAYNMVACITATGCKGQTLA